MKTPTDKAIDYCLEVEGQIHQPYIDAFLSGYKAANESDECCLETYCIVKIKQTDMHALIRIKNYFGENDKTQLEHLAYDVLYRVTKEFNENSKPIE